MFIKICGLTDEPGVEAAVAAGADALGFVFAESARRIAPEQAVRLAAAAPANVIRVAVMKHPSAALVDEVLRTFEPDWLQSDAEDFATIVLPPGCAALPVYREGCDLDQDFPQRLLFEGAVSGSGTTADWSQARRLARGRELVLAGGLHAGNVAAAIDRVRPWGIDVSSGVEARRGRKDPAKIHELIALVRALEK